MQKLGPRNRLYTIDEHSPALLRIPIKLRKVKLSDGYNTDQEESDSARRASEEVNGLDGRRLAPQGKVDQPLKKKGSNANNQKKFISSKSLFPSE